MPFLISVPIPVPIPIPIPMPRFQCRGLQMARYVHRICKIPLFTKRLKKTFTAINKVYFKWDYNPFQKQPPEVLYKKAVLTFCNILRKTPVLEPLFNKIAVLQFCIFGPATWLKTDSNTGVSCEYCETFENNYFEEHLKDGCSVAKRNHWNLPLSIFMFSCANLYYKYAQSNSYREVNFKSVKITDMKSTPLRISYHFWTCKHLDKLDQKAIWLFSVSYRSMFISGPPMDKNIAAAYWAVKQSLILLNEWDL